MELHVPLMHNIYTKQFLLLKTIIISFFYCWIYFIKILVANMVKSWVVLKSMEKVQWTLDVNAIEDLFRYACFFTPWPNFVSNFTPRVFVGTDIRQRKQRSNIVSCCQHSLLFLPLTNLSYTSTKTKHVHNDLKLSFKSSLYPLPSLANSGALWNGHYLYLQ